MRVIIIIVAVCQQRRNIKRHAGGTGEKNNGCTENKIVFISVDRQVDSSSSTAICV